MSMKYIFSVKLNMQSVSYVIPLLPLIQHFLFKSINIFISICHEYADHYSRGNILFLNIVPVFLKKLKPEYNNFFLSCLIVYQKPEYEQSDSEFNSHSTKY